MNVIMIRFKTFTYISALLICFGIASCDDVKVTKSLSNLPEDVKQAEQYTFQFYQFVATDKYDSLFSYFNISGGDTLIKKNQLMVKKLIGDVVRLDLDIVATKRITENDQATIHYRIDLINHHDSSSVRERLELMKKGDKVFFTSNHIQME